MSNSLTLFTPDNRPAHIKALFGKHSNISDRVTVPSLTYEGKTWNVSINGEKQKLQRQNDEGDWEPVSIMRVAILDYAKRRGRTYYPGTYVEGRPGRPLCWSDDGIRPHASVDEPQNPTCDGCPMSIKQPRITESGQRVTSAPCTQQRMVAVVPIPANKTGFTPLRLKLAITSDYDGKSPELEVQGWYAFSNFIGYLRANGIDHTSAVLTKLRFDPNVNWPKVMFSAERYLSEAEAASIEPLIDSNDTKALLTGVWTPNGAEGQKTAEPVEDDEVRHPLPTVLTEDWSLETRSAPKSDLARVRAKTEEELEADIASDPDWRLQPAPEIELPTSFENPGKKRAKKVTPKPEAPSVISTEIPDDVLALIPEWTKK